MAVASTLVDKFQRVFSSPIFGAPRSEMEIDPPIARMMSKSAFSSFHVSRQDVPSGIARPIRASKYKHSYDPWRSIPYRRRSSLLLLHWENFQHRTSR